METINLRSASHTLSTGTCRELNVSSIAQTCFFPSQGSISSKASVRRRRQGTVVAISKEALQKVQQAISQAQAEEKRKPGIPRPPLDGGPGLINLSGREDLEAQRVPFKKPLSQPLTPPEPPEQVEEPKPQAVSKANEGRETFLLPSPLTPAQRGIVLGMIGLTIVAFGRSSEGVVQDDIREFLQFWMRLAWGSHAVLGVVAAIVAAGKQKPPLKWFIKVAASGALGLQEVLQLPAEGR